MDRCGRKSSSASRAQREDDGERRKNGLHAFCPRHVLAFSATRYLVGLVFVVAISRFFDLWSHTRTGKTHRALPLLLRC